MMCSNILLNQGTAKIADVCFAKILSQSIHSQQVRLSLPHIGIELFKWGYHGVRPVRSSKKETQGCALLGPRNRDCPDTAEFLACKPAGQANADFCLAAVILLWYAASSAPQQAHPGCQADALS